MQIAGIFISYSPDGTFNEKRFVVDLVQQIKENNLAEDIWYKLYNAICKKAQVY